MDIRHIHMRGRGFSLIELLVVMGIIGILLALALPALRSARQSARDVSQLSNLHQTALVIQNYVDTYEGSLPFAPRGSTFLLTPPDEPKRMTITPGFWDLSVYWPALMHEIAPWRQHFKTWIVPDPRRVEGEPWRWEDGVNSFVGIPSYALCRSMYARPKLWYDEPLDDPERTLAPVRYHEVRSSSAKVMMYDREKSDRLAADASEMEKDLRAMLFTDGHAEQRQLSNATDPVRPRIPNAPGPDVLHDTYQGAHGIDYR